MGILDIASDDQFGELKNEPAQESPLRETMQPGEHINPHQFAGLINSAPPAPVARHPHYVGGMNIHDYRESLDGGFGKEDN